MPGERDALVENSRERRRETFRRIGQAHHEAARALDPRVVRGVWPGQVPVMRGLFGENVGLEGSGHEDGDSYAERRDLLREGLGPPFESSLGCGVGADRRYPSDAALA